MAVSLPNEHKVVFYGSPDLKRWGRLSDFGPAGGTAGQWECPDMFELPVDGDGSNTRWVLKVGLNPGGLQGGSGEQYFVGRFDGTRFINDNPSTLTLWSDYGKDCYCALTFNNHPRPVMIGWMNNWEYANKVPTSPWRGQMTIPRELSLKKFPEDIRLVQKPVDALKTLRVNHTIGKPDLEIKGRTFTVSLMMDPHGAKQAGWKLYSGDSVSAIIGYDSSRKEVFVDRVKNFAAHTAAPYPDDSGPITFDILVDRDSIEVFTAGGRVAITNLIFAAPPTRLLFYSEGPAEFISADLWSLRSIW